MTVSRIASAFTHFSRCALDVNVVQTTLLSLGFVQPISCIKRRFDLVFDAVAT